MAFGDTILNIFTCSAYDFTDKERCISNLVSQMLLRTQSIFKYKGLPDTFDKRHLELFTQTNGFCGWYEHNGKIYADKGGLGGNIDYNYMPRNFIVANPYIPLNKTFTVGENCVIFPNDALYIGLIPIFRRYASAIVENDISMQFADINARIPSLISAPDDVTKASAEEYISQIRKGNLAIIGENGFFDGIRTSPYNSSQSRGGLTDLIEYQQYLKASWFNELGLDANYNMKRESLNSAESQMNKDALIPLIDNMLETRRNALEKINKMFGLNVEVELNSAWEDNAEEIELAHDAVEENSKRLEEETEDDDGGDEVVNND